MALLQISEPGQSSKPHQRKLAVGIDLGTTNSLIATVRSGQADTLADINGEHLLPSVVRFRKHDCPQVGHSAQRHIVDDAANTIVSVKRLMGRGAQDIKSLSNELPYVFEQGSQGMPMLRTIAGQKSPVQVAAEILRTLVQHGEASLGGKLEGAVVTVPAYFDDAQRQATKDAAKLAGVSVLRLLNEPTAAAVAYGLEHKQNATVAVFDLGGGTFDISVLKMEKGVFEVLATGGDSALGGDDFDYAIAIWICESLGFEAELSLPQQRYLLCQARMAKEALCKTDNIVISLEQWPSSNATAILAQDQISLSLEQMNGLLDPIIDRTMAVCKQTLRAAAVTIADLDQVVLVGGSTRTLRVRQQVAAFFQCQPLTSIDPDRVVAIGAARQADVLIGNRNPDELLLLDVLPLSLGLETMGGLVERIIERNSPIPAAQAQEFTTYQDGQTAMMIHVLQGERELVQDCRSLARFELRGIPPMVAGSAKIRVTFQVDADGLLNVSARELSSNIVSEIQVQPSYGLTEDQMATMLQDAWGHAEADQVSRGLREQQVEAERLTIALEKALEDDGERLLTQEQLVKLRQGLQRLASLRAGQDHEALAKGVDQLTKASDEFAALRMDESIRQALAGQPINVI